jgi:NEDD8-activating enzyme E1 regulatory subunit
MATADKYDRQLRLWGSNGQKLLMNSHILLVGADAVGTETLKNLVLPGVGSFTILDEGRIQEKDKGSNFFLPNGDYRAKSASEYLCEMNSDVTGHFKISSIHAELRDGNDLTISIAVLNLIIDPNFLRAFSLVVLANPIISVRHHVSLICAEQHIPLIVLRSYGFIGTYQVQLPGEHGIIESKPEAEQPDLRLNVPFPELEVI